MTVIYKAEHAVEVREAADLLEGLGFRVIGTAEGFCQDRQAQDGRIVSIRHIGESHSQLVLLIDNVVTATSLIGVDRPAKDGLLRLFARATAVRAPIFDFATGGGLCWRTDCGAPAGRHEHV